MRSLSLKFQAVPNAPARSAAESRPAGSNLSKSPTLAAMSLGYGVVQLDVPIVNATLTAGPLFGGGLIALIGWRSIFLVNLPIGLAGLWLTFRNATETTRQPQREIDLPGQLAAIGCLGCLAAAIIEGGTLGRASAFVIAGFAAAAVLGLLFVLQELRTPQPMLPLSLFRHRMFAPAALVGLLVNVAV